MSQRSNRQLIRLHPDLERMASDLLYAMEECALNKVDPNLEFPLKENSDLKQALKSFIKDQLLLLEGRARSTKKRKLEKEKKKLEMKSEKKLTPYELRQKGYLINDDGVWCRQVPECECGLCRDPYGGYKP